MTEHEQARDCVARIREILSSPEEVFPEKLRVGGDFESLRANGGTISPEMIRWTVAPNEESIEVSAEPAIFAIVTELLNAEGIGFGIYPDKCSLTIPLPRF